MSKEYNYSSSKKSIIFLGNKGKVVSFMPFLAGLSFAKKANITENKTFWGDIILTNGTELNYKLGFHVVADSANSALVNHRKFGNLARMIVPLKKQNHSWIVLKY